MLMSLWVFVWAKPIKLPELKLTIGAVCMCQGYGQRKQEGKTHMHMRNWKTCIVLRAYWDSKLYNIKGLLQWHKRASREGLTPCHQEKGGQCEGGGQRGGPFPFKAKQTIMKLRYFLQEWRTDYPPFQQGTQEFSESITFVLMLKGVYIGV